VLTLTDLHAYYGKAHVLQGVSLLVCPGQVVGLYGRNGVGKTTLVKTIMGLIADARGKLTLSDVDLTPMRANERAQAGVGLMPQGVRVFRELTVAENYHVAANSVRSPRPLDDILKLIPEIGPLLKQQAGRLSGGQQQLVSLARTLATNCKILMMDEPTEGLMPTMVGRIGEVAQAMAQQGMGVLLVEQNLQLGAAVCHHINLMEKGNIVATGTYDTLKETGALGRALGI
jgi:ABC-type branched-subunit amino acid transport system ATPase component